MFIAPKLSPHLVFYWDAFADLDSCRLNGMSVGRIPWIAVKDYAQTYGIRDSDELEAFTEIIFAMDRVYRDACNEKPEDLSKPKRSAKR